MTKTITIILFIFLDLHQREEFVPGILYFSVKTFGGGIEPEEALKEWWIGTGNFQSIFALSA